MFVNARSRAVLDRAGMQHSRTFHVAFDDPLPGAEHGEVESQACARDWTEPRSQGFAEPGSRGQ